MSRFSIKYNHDSKSYLIILFNKRISIKRTLFTGAQVAILVVILSTFILSFYEMSENVKLRDENRILRDQFEILNEDLDKANKVLSDIQERDDKLFRFTFEATPVDKTLREESFSDRSDYEYLEGLSNAEIVINTSLEIDKLCKQSLVASHSYDELLSLSQEQKNRATHIPSVYPVDDPYIVSIFKMRLHPIYGHMVFHYGVDFRAAKGTPVYATGDGKVITTRTSRTGFGKHIILDHGYQYKTIYAHLSKFDVKKGDVITRGQLIGYSGSTGTSSGPHLHYEVRKNDVPVDPKFYFFQDLTPNEYSSMIELDPDIDY